MEPLIFVPLKPSRVRINLNAVTADGTLRVGFEDIEGGPLRTRALVEVHEPEDEVTGIAYVARVNEKAKLAYLEVVWSSLHDLEHRDPVYRVNVSLRGSTEWGSMPDETRHAPKTTVANL